MFEEKKGDAHGLVVRARIVLLCHPSQLYTQCSVPVLSQTTHLEGIKSRLTSAVSSLVSPSCAVRAQRMMSPLHVHVKYLTARNPMLSMNFKDTDGRDKPA